MDIKPLDSLKIPPSKCCICNNSATGSESVKLSSNSDDKSNSSIQNNLFVIYYVTKLLEIPSSICEEYLLCHGHPQEWISFCRNCRKLVAEGRKIFTQILALQDKHKVIRKRIKLLMNVKREVENDSEEIQLRNGRKNDEGASNDIRHYLQLSDSLNPDLEEQEQGNSILLPEPDITPFADSSENIEVKVKGFDELELSYFDEDDNNPNVEDDYMDEINEDNEEEFVITPKRPKRSSRKKLDYRREGEDESKSESVTDDEEFVIAARRHRSRKAPTTRLRTKSDDKQTPPTPKESSSKTKTSPNKSKSRSRSRNRERYNASRRKPIPLSKTLSEVVAIHEEEMSKVPQITRSSTKDEKIARGIAVRNLRVSNLCKKYHVKEFPCKYCPSVQSKYKEWMNHMKDCPKKPNKIIGEGFECEDCGKQVGSLFSLENHRRLIHLDPSFLKCSGCNEIFKNTFHFNVHILQDSPKESECFKNCIKCPRKTCKSSYYPTQEALDVHNFARHGDRPHPFKCDECKNTFGSRGAYYKHFPHVREKVFNCDKCEAKFKTKEHLSRHIQTVHLAKEPGAQKYPCHVCKKEFTVRNRLLRHLQIHNEESPYLCTICGKGFKICNYLTIHMWSHDPDRKLKYSLYKPKSRLKYINNRKKKLEGRDQSEMEESSSSSIPATKSEEASVSHPINEPTPETPMEQELFQVPSAGDFSVSYTLQLN